MGQILELEGWVVMWLTVVRVWNSFIRSPEAVVASHVSGRVSYKFQG